jgi:hypothetical protein
MSRQREGTAAPTPFDAPTPTSGDTATSPQQYGSRFDFVAISTRVSPDEHPTAHRREIRIAILVGATVPIPACIAALLRRHSPIAVAI